MNLKFAFCLPLFLAVSLPLSAAVIGTNPPARPLTMERIDSLKEQKAAWREYLERSTRQMQADKDFLQAEMKAHGITAVTNAPATGSTRGIRLDNSPDYYSGAEAQRIAKIIASFQIPSGGWSKNLNMTRNERVPGQAFTSDNASRFLTNGDLDTPHDSHWSYVGTFDNDATITQMRFLAKVITATTNDQDAPFRASFLRGLDYVFNAQYPNGGWPQVWPLEGGYHDAITINDDAMLNVLELLNDTAAGQDEFAFVPEAARARARAAFQHGLDCLLAAQITVAGHRIVWCQQHDPLTLEPASARNYEMPSATSAESATIMMFLMQLPDPSPRIIASVDAAAAWFEKTQIRDVAYRSNGVDGRRLIPAPGEGPLWARFYDIGTDRPIFGDRDKTIHDQVNEISKERRQGYGWYRDTPKRALEHYPRWHKEHPGTSSAK